MTTKNTLADKYENEYVNLASARLGAEVIFATDDFFADKQRLIADAEPISKLGTFDNNGQWMDGWESRRRRDGGQDHAIIKLGCLGAIKAVDIDTSYFTGNYPPAASIFACASETPPTDQSVWVEIVPATDLGPNTHTIVEVDDETPYNWLRLNMHPDGGIARLRVYGVPFCNWQNKSSTDIHELSAVKNAGRIVAYNNAHYGGVWALLAEGRGINMGDGWETRRRREPGNDWIIIELGHAGFIEKIECDTAHFKGNFPDMFSLDAAYIEAGTDSSITTDAMFWQELLPKQKLSADNQHYFDKSHLNDIGKISHVKLNIYPDGGISRLRIFGKLAK
ncbi:MAG: allantoicase [Rhizobiales bacterium]|nr:allantoicase [Hyphomicrobiales bacterium]NRB14534.1 allantoicase [Hyphomicrobiales bacterium]